MIRVVIDSLRQSLFDADSRFVLLKQEGAERFIPIGLSDCEFRQLAFRLRHPSSIRQQTYDFFFQFIRQTDLSVRKVYIHSRTHDRFQAQVIGVRPGLGIARGFAVDCRASDALLTAVHFQVPIFASEPLVTHATLSWDELVSAKKTRIYNTAPPEPLEEAQP